MNITRIFEYMRNIWISLETLSRPFFEWLSTELEIIEMTPFELIFGVGLILIMGRVILKFIGGIG